MSGKTMAAPAVDQKQIGTGEFIWYMVSVFFYTNMTGMVGQYRNNFLVMWCRSISTRRRCLTRW